MNEASKETVVDYTKLSPEEIISLHKNNKSESIRYLTSLGKFTTSQIAKMLNIRYQFVRNVQKEPVRKK